MSGEGEPLDWKLNGRCALDLGLAVGGDTSDVRYANRATSFYPCSLHVNRWTAAGIRSRSLIPSRQHRQNRRAFVFVSQGIYNSSSVTQVNIPAATGDMGILANHVPTVEALRPGLLEIIETSGTKKYFGTLRDLSEKLRIVC
jgi:hypothetical protein